MAMKGAAVRAASVLLLAQVALAFTPSLLPTLRAAPALRPAVAPRGQTLPKLHTSLQATVSDKETAAETKKQPAPGRGVLKCKPIGVSFAAPEVRLSNEGMEKVVDTTSEWIRTRTGIEARHVLDGTEDVRSLAVRAAEGALESSGIKAEDIDMVIVATSSPEDLFGDAPSVAAAIGAKNAFAMDLTAACSGFLFSTVTAGQFLNNGAAKNALVVGADALSRWVNWEDRNTCVLFGDGAGAMVLTATETEEEAGLLGFEMHSDGNGYCNLKLPFTPEVDEIGEGVKVAQGTYSPISMVGKEVYKFATRDVPRVLEEALVNAGVDASEVDHLLLHQANIRIMEVVADRLGIPMEKVLHNLEEYGNTSAASIPICLAEAVASGKVKKGDVIACAGFGAGLSWGACILRWG
uniref:beta-ketoacyl-[acyl-carrier-protein] synthase III n=2 Tax=Hemiselmis andersenii TaxID=464988 RepID=A0A7S1DKB9_HEMAN